MRTQSNDPKILHEEIRILTDEILRLREELRQLRETLVPRSWEPPLEFCLTSKEAILLAALYKSPQSMTKSSLMTLMYQFSSADEVPDIKIIDVFVCKLRKKLKPFGIIINTVWGQGYQLEDASRTLLDNWNVAQEPVAA